MPYNFDEDDEVIQAYKAEYELEDDEVTKGQRTKILNLTASVRQAKRLDYESKTKALASLGNLERRLAEIRVFFPSEHPGYNRLIESLESSLKSLHGHLDDKFS